MRLLICCLVSLIGVCASECETQDECLASQSVSLLQTHVNLEARMKQEPAEPTAVEATSSTPAAAPTPKFTAETMPRVSTTLKCIINLGTQYFALYTALAIVRTLNSFRFELIGLQKILETGCSTITYAPMLCCLFLGVRMRAIQLAQGDTERYHLPQPWVQNGMLASSYAVVGQVVLVLLGGVASGMNNVQTDKEGNLDIKNLPQSNTLVVGILTFVRYIIVVALYGGFVAVVAGVFQMEGPQELWPDGTIPVSPAVGCTILMSSLFFLVYLLVAVSRTACELSETLRQTQGLLKLEKAAEAAKMTVDFAPMLCILFIGARMRALQMDPKEGHPQPWAQKCFFACTFSVLLQAALCILLPFAAGGECKRGSVQGDVSFTVENTIVAAILTAVRYICLFGLYGGVCAIIYSIQTLQAPGGPEKTPPLSPAMKCVMCLTLQYFLVYTLLFICVTVKSFVAEYSFTASMMTTGIAIADAGRATVMFAPMLAVLFIGTRLRSLQIAASADGTVPVNAGPQKWAQDCMYLATFSVFLQLCMTMLATLVMGERQPQLDVDGNVKPPANTNKYIAMIFEAVRYINMINMYFGASAIVLAIFLMTPNDLQPYSVKGLLPTF